MSSFKLLVLSFIILALPVQGAEELAPIEVTNAKEASPFTFSRSHYLSTEELERETIPLAINALDQTPGVIVLQNGGLGGRTSFFIRGTESRHVAFILDELKLNDPSNTDRQFDGAFLSLPSIKEIKLHQGPQAVVFGSDALGGLVEMVTRKGENAPQTRLSFTGGSFGTVSGSLSQDWRNAEHQGTLSFLHLRTDGISRLNEERFNASERDAAQSTQLTSSSRHRWGIKLSTDFLVSYLHGLNELDGLTSDSSVDESANDQYILQQKTSYQIAPETGVSLRNGLSRHHRELNSEIGGESFFAGNLVQNELLIKRERISWQATAGILHEHEDASFADFRPDSDLVSVFIQTVKRVGLVAVQAGLRGENHSLFGKFLTGSAGLSLSLGEDKLSAQFSRGFKAPSLYQLYAPDFQGSPIGNTELEPETNSSWELKWLREKALYQTGLVFFQNNLENLITFTAIGYQGQLGYKVQGIEAWWLFRQDRWLLRLSGTHQSFSNEENPVLLRPGNMAQIMGSWFITDDQEIYSKLRWLNDRRDLAAGSRIVKLNAYETVELGYRITQREHAITLQILNLLDRKFEELYGYSVMPRSYFASYAISF